MSKQRSKCLPQPCRLAFVVGPKAEQPQPSRCRPCLLPMGCARACGGPALGTAVRQALLGHPACWAQSASVAIWMDFLIFSTPHLRKARLGEPSGPLWVALVLLSPCPGAKMPACHSFSPLGKFRHTACRGSGPKEWTGVDLPARAAEAGAGNCFLHPKLRGSALTRTAAAYPLPPPTPYRRPTARPWAVRCFSLSCSFPRALTCLLVIITGTGPYI